MEEAGPDAAAGEAALEAQPPAGGDPAPEGAAAEGMGEEALGTPTPAGMRGGGGGAPGASRADSRLVRTGAHVVLRDAQGMRKVAFVSARCEDLRISRYPPIPASAFVGLPYGATLEYEDGSWSRRRATASSAPCEAPAAVAEAIEEAYETNQHLSQQGGAQALSSSDVKAMKAERSGEQVVEALASNSATFASKTKFAQEKYLRKKAQRHLQQVAFLRPSLMELCETYFQQFRAKICGLRFDYLSSLLCQMDVREGRRYLVIDSACGLVVAAMAQQMHGLGSIFRAYRKNSCSDRALAELDLGERRAVMRPIPFEVIASKDPLTHEWVTPEEGSKLAGQTEKLAARRASLQDLEAASVDGLVVVAGEEELEWANEFLEVGLSRLAPGGRLAVFGHVLQPLAAQQGALRSSGGFVDVKMHQLHTREWQVLPQRTHPVMTVDAMPTDGFLLLATKVAREDKDHLVAEEQGCQGGGGGKRRKKGSGSRR